MAHDPYSPCLCGSGKKLKFCCQDILTEMIRVEKLIDHQPEAAEKILRDLRGKFKEKEVVATQLAMLLARRGELQGAQDELVGFLKDNPDEPRALVCLAEICVTQQGFPNARRLVHRAFQLAARSFPAGVSQLAARIAGQMAQLGCTMSMREHLALGVRMAPGERRQSMLMQLANFESQRSVPYPFRGRFALLPVELSDETQKQEELRARRVSQIGCWEPASILYTRLVEKNPNNGAIWHNLGLFQAWDGKLKEAVASLQKSAELLEDFDTAAETSALAQLIEMDVTEDTYSVMQQSIPVSSVSELLTKLDNAPRIARVQSSSEDEQAERIAAEYEFLTADLTEGMAPEDLPDVVADITIFDGDEETGGPRALIVGLNEDIDSAIDAFQEVAGDLAEDVEEDSKSPLSRMPNQCRLFDWKIHHADGVGSSRFRDLDQARLNEAMNTWLDTDLPGLGGTSPIEAAKDANNLVKVAGSVLALDVVCNRMGYDPDLTETRSRLGVAAPSTLEIAEDESVTSLPLIQLSRLEVDKLTDDQIIDYANRVTLVRHLNLLDSAVEELVKREEALEKFSPMRAHLLRANVARERNDMERASACFEDARVAVEDEEDAFRTKLELDIRELSCRLDNPEDPILPNLLEQIRDRYFTKIPEIEEVIREELTNSGCPQLLDKLSPAIVTAGAASSGEGKGGKLWLPGQD